MEKHIQLSTLTFKGQDFDILVNKGKISYIFERGGFRYGNAVQIKGRSHRDVVDAAFNLLINMIETHEANSK